MRQFTFCIVLGLLVITGNAQHPIVSYGNSLITFGSVIEVTDLPVPEPYMDYPDPDLYYSGQISELNQYAQFDNFNNLLFFVNDGNIYDSEGYLIAENKIYAEDAEDREIAMGGSDLAVTNLPGHCDKFLIVCSVQRLYQSTEYIPLGFILDMSEQNPNFSDYPERKGRVRSFGDDDELVQPYDTYEYNYNDTQFPIPVENLRAEYSAIEVVEVNDNLKYLVLSFRHEGVITIGLTENGLTVLDYCLADIQDPDEAEEFSLIEIQQINSDYRIASVTECENFGVNNDRIQLFNMDSNGMVSLESEIYPFDYPVSTIEYISGLEFTSSANKLWFTKNESPFIGVYDYSEDEISYPFQGLNSDFGFSELEIGLDELGNEVIYISSSTGLAQINSPDDIQSASISLNIPWASNISVPRFNITGQTQGFSLQSQHVNIDNQASFLLSADCCRDLGEITNADMLTEIDETFNGTWSPGNNPLGDEDGVIRVFETIEFVSGVNISLLNLTFEFDEDAELIIQPGATLRMNNSHLTSLSCESIMWPGVNVLGNPNLDQYPPYNSGQGVLRMTNNSKISNAINAIEIGTNSSNSGGMVRASDSKIYNCANGVKFMAYNNILDGIVYDNLSRFVRCQFGTLDQLIDEQYSPGNHAYLYFTHGVKFIECSFVNTTSEDIYPESQRGNGIYSLFSDFICTGTNATYDYEGDTDHTGFYKLNLGILSLGTPAHYFQADKLEFYKNKIGIGALGVWNEHITRNNFTVKESDELLGNDPVGCWLINSSGYMIEENLFTESPDFSYTFGLVIDNSGEAENLVFRNTFENLLVGLYVEHDNRGEVTNTGLQARCNWFEENRFDIYLTSESEWRDNQGDANEDASDLSNNRFSLGSHDCSFYGDVGVNSGYGILSAPDGTLDFDYFCLEDPFTFPDCQDIHLNAITPGDFLGYPYDYEVLCVSSFSNDGGGMILSDEYGIITELNHRKELLIDARTNYEITVDNGDSEGLINTINTSLPDESLFLKNLLLQKYPLSDEVMKAAISKADPMDPWHLTQVMVANAPLSKGLTSFLEDSDVLSDFFMSFIYNANAGGAIGSLAKLLELEVSYRSSKYYEQLQNLQSYHHFYSGDSTLANLNLELLDLPDWNSLVTSTNRAHFSENSIAFNEGLSEIENYSEELADWFEFVATFPNELYSFSSVLIDQLHSKYSFGNEESGFALAYLMALGEIQDFPELKEPVTERSYLVESTLKDKSEFIGIYPNPVRSIAYFTYPIELDGIAEVSVLDVSGRVIISKSILSSGGIKEFKFDKLKSGLYFIEVNIEEQVLETIKFIK